MKLKKIIAAVAAAAVAVSTMAVNAFAADYTAKLGFADTAWAAQDWESSVQVTGDGTYSIESTAVAGAVDFGVFVIDIEGMFADNPEATAVLDSVEIDGAAIDFDAAKIVYGDIEEKGNYRIEIYNQYGTSKDDPGVNQATPIASSVKVTFTVSGLGGAAADATADAPAADTTAEAPASDATTTSTGTGNTTAAVILSVMAVAGAAAVASRKRK
ncbi:MAG: hypothetical protein MRZ61_02205 [Oscillospiraceae bacterium]|nr:hypothetical protein [Oscillospiraceae bacterium]